MNITQAPSPNFNDRRGPLDMLVLHYTGMESGEAALERMCDPAAEVSAHYMVWEDGRISQLVEEDKRAWHAGVGTWQGDSDLNSRSVGIEIVNGGHNVPRPDGSLPPYPSAQIEAVIALGQAIVSRHAIPQTRIVGHSDIAPDRKEDPGEHFPWEQLANAGLGLWPALKPAGDGLMGTGLVRGDTGAPVKRLQAAMAEIGYGVTQDSYYGLATEAAITAFQRRWLPDRLNGQAGWTTIARIEAVREVHAAWMK